MILSCYYNNTQTQAPNTHTHTHLLTVVNGMDSGIEMIYFHLKTFLRENVFS